MELKYFKQYTTKELDAISRIIEEMTGSQLARECEVTNWTFNRWKKDFLNDGLIEYTQNEKEKRDKYFRLTKKGRRLKELLLEMNTILK